MVGFRGSVGQWPAGVCGRDRSDLRRDSVGGVWLATLGPLERSPVTWPSGFLLSFCYYSPRGC